MWSSTFAQPVCLGPPIFYLVKGDSIHFVGGECGFMVLDYLLEKHLERYGEDEE